MADSKKWLRKNLVHKTSSQTLTPNRFRMLTILDPADADYDYTALTDSYMGVFNTQSFYQFLNTTQTGYAHTSSGTELGYLLRSVVTSLTLCTIQLTMFCLFRNIFKTLYQPRCYCVPTNERIDPLPKGFFNWIVPTLQYNIHHYLSLGLDAYFFIRFINVLLLYFIVIGTLNIMILIPINITGSNGEYSASGLDKLSLSNISATKVHSLNAHFIMSLITIGFFHWLLVYEMESFIKIRQTYLFTKKHQASVSSRTLLITNLPDDLLDEASLTSAFSAIPGGVKAVWFLDDYKRTSSSVRMAREALVYLEAGEIKYLQRYYRRVSSKRYQHYTDLNRLRPYFYPPIHLKIQFPLMNTSLRFQLWGCLRIFMLQKREDQILWSVKKLKQAKEAIDQERDNLAAGRLEKFNAAFVQFGTQVGAYTAHQCLLSETQGYMDKTIIEVHPRDIKWSNLTKGNRATLLVERYLVVLVCICIIILYVIPVSFIGLISQIPLLTKLMPFFKWIYGLPEEARDCISSILPSLLLSVLTDVMMYLFRFFSYYKGKLTGAEIEVDLQKWYFGFLFIHQFLVVTILSSITVIFKQIVDQPTSIPVMLATNLPKAAIFFFQFIAVKALGFCGNNFLRIDQLILRNTWYRFRDNTPRLKFSRITNLLKIKWGTIYPIYSVYASIGLTYTIISPLISLFVVFILSLLLLYYKYALRYIYSHINESENNGKLYPHALLQLFAGIYCLECCLVGIFFLLKDVNGNLPMKAHGWVMAVVLVATIFGNITIYKRYVKYFSNLPILFKPEEHLDSKEQEIPKDLISNYKLLYLHPNFKYDLPKVWLPSDPMKVSEEELVNIHQSDGIEGVITPGATIKFRFFNLFLDLTVVDAPADYKGPI